MKRIIGLVIGTIAGSFLVRLVLPSNQS